MVPPPRSAMARSIPGAVGSAQCRSSTASTIRRFCRLEDVRGIALLSDLVFTLCCNLILIF
jgi:hypothetical protein